MPTRTYNMDESADSATSLLESQTPSSGTQQSTNGTGTAATPPVVIVSGARSSTLNSSIFNNLLFSSSAASAAAAASSASGRTSRRAGRGRNRRIRSSRRSANSNSHLSNHVTLMNHHLSQRQAATSTTSSAGGGGGGGGPGGSSSCTYAFSLSTSPTCFSLLTDANKKSERNLFSACCAVFCVAILAVSLVETRWFYLSGGGCNLNHIGVADFFAPGRLEYTYEPSLVEKTQIPVYSFILPNGAVLKNCTNREILLIMRTIIAFVFLAIFSSCVGLMLDTIGCMKSSTKVVRRHGIFHVLTVLLCLTINGFCFWISERMYDQQHMTRAKRGKKVEVSFDVSYYLIVLASMLSILATAFTLIKRYPSDEDEQLERLLEEYTGFEEPLHLERSLPAAPPSTLNRPAGATAASSTYFDTYNESSGRSSSYPPQQLTAHSFSVQPLNSNSNSNNSNADDSAANHHQSSDLYDYANSSDLVQFNQPARLSTLSRISLLPSLLQHSQQQQQQQPPPDSNHHHHNHQRPQQHHLLLHQQQAPPPPPLTPPPSLHSNVILNQINQHQQAQSSRSNLVNDHPHHHHHHHAATSSNHVVLDDDSNDNYYQLQAPLADPPPPYDPTPVLA